MTAPQAPEASASARVESHASYGETSPERPEGREGEPEQLFTPRFFLMCGFSFTVFLSAFQLLPVAPYRILALGGTAAAAGLFLGFLTYSSAGTAPLTGALTDRLGPRRVLIVASLAITGL